MNLPISLSLITNPITSLREPGLSIASGDQLSVLMFNPGGLTSPPLIIFAPFLIYLLVSLASIDQRKPAVISLLTLLFAVTFSSYYIEGNSSESQRVWSGPLIVFAQLLLLLSVFAVGERLIPLHLLSQSFW